jgi:arginyl-tRNA synthetase
MSSVQQIIRDTALQVIRTLYNLPIEANELQIQTTNPEFEGDYTLVLFPLIKKTGKQPVELAKEIGANLLQEQTEVFTAFNLIKGFLNLTISDTYWLRALNRSYNNPHYGIQNARGERVMIEYSSPNTNKPLHLGHLRNNFLGWSVAEIYKACGYEVVKTCIVNDRGVHICKSMIAWQRYANGATPENTGIKGDHLVGDYYVKFNEVYKAETEALVAGGMTKEQAEKDAPIMKAAQQMLLDWEQGNPEIIALWKRMNQWVYAGFETTYKRIGSDFHKTYYESNTYLLGKKTVEDGLKSNVFYQKDDGSVWIDLTADGLDEKIVQRKDGTSVYITQDIGLAQLRYDEFKSNTNIYVIGDEQNYHMKVLQLICKKLGLAYADGIHHLSYGMVELPTGKMKSREGTVVDADALLDEMEAVAKQKTEALGKVEGFNDEERSALYKILSLGALKYFLLRVGPKKKMIFNPEESIDFQGHTGPFIQYTHARIKSILRKASVDIHEVESSALLPLEKELLILLESYPQVIQQACTEQDPSHVANYVYGIAKTFNSFYTQHSVLNAENEEKKNLELK